MGMALILLYVAFPLPIYGTIWLLLIAYVTRYMPYGMRSASGAIVQIHSELEEAASASGASWWETFKRVTLPLLRPGIAAGWIYICIVSFREFSTSVLLATGESRVLFMGGAGGSPCITTFHRWVTESAKISSPPCRPSISIFAWSTFAACRTTDTVSSSATSRC
jgi:ABC-type spermidine/putrescine transport system permease subunit I